MGGGLEPSVTEKDVRDKFYVHGEIRSIRMVKKQCCSFVTFVEREAAEAAATKLHRILELKGKKVHVMWGRPQQSIQNQACHQACQGCQVSQQWLVLQAAIGPTIHLWIRPQWATLLWRARVQTPCPFVRKPLLHHL